MLQTNGLLLQILFHIPLYLVWLAAIIFGFRYRHRYPRMVALLLVGIVVLIAASLVDLLAGLNLPIWLHSQLGMPIERALLILRLMQAGSLFGQAAGWVLVVMAVFSGRAARKNETSAP